MDELPAFDDQGKLRMVVERLDPERKVPTTLDAFRVKWSFDGASPVAPLMQIAIPSMLGSIRDRYLPRRSQQAAEPETPSFVLSVAPRVTAGVKAKRRF